MMKPTIEMKALGAVNPDVWSSNSHTLIDIRLGYDFEPHNRASETWEYVWEAKINSDEHPYRFTYKAKTLQGLEDKLRGVFGIEPRPIVEPPVIVQKVAAQWVSTDVRNPADGEEVLIVYRTRTGEVYRELAHQYENPESGELDWYFTSNGDHLRDEEVLYWQPLADIPKEASTGR
jgi:hypothetical protein